MYELFAREKTHEELIQDLQVQVTAAEMHLTFFASRHGKESEMYQESLRDFARVWASLKEKRQPEDFLKDIA